MAAVKRLIVVSVILILPLSYLAAYNTLAVILPPVLYTAAGAAMIILTVGAFGGAWIFSQMLKTRVAELANRRVISQAEALEAEARAQKALTDARVIFFTAPKGAQVIVRDQDRDSNYRQLHLNPNAIVNGHYERPDDLQMQIYNQYHLGKRPKEELIIDAPPIDLPVLTDGAGTGWIERVILPAPHIHYCGATRSGKTTLANHQLEHIRRQAPDTRFFLLNPKATAARKPFIIKPDYSDISEALEGLAAFNKLMGQRKNNPALSQSDHKIVFIVDEWDWIYSAYGQEAVRLLVPLVKVGAELGIKVILIGQSPLTGDTGLSQSFYHNMVRVAIWQEGSRLLRDFPLDKKYKAPLMGRYEQLKEMAPQFEAETGQKLRYCAVVPMAGNPTVEVIPFLSDPEPVETISPIRIQKPTPEEREKLLVWWQMKREGTLSGNKLHQRLTGQTSNASTAQIQKLRDLVTKFGEEPGF